MIAVDVLAVMKRATYAAPDMGDEMREARAAVAELMERERIMREALEDLRKQCKNNLELGATGPGYWTDAQETIDAALAAAGGAK